MSQPLENQNHHYKEISQPPHWEVVGLTDPEALIDELLTFWTSQTVEDNRYRFCGFQSPAGLRRCYQTAFEHARLTLVMRSGPRLIGLALGCANTKQPHWLFVSLEVDRGHRRLGYGFSALSVLYDYALAHGYAGIAGTALADNHATIRNLDKFAHNKPHHSQLDKGLVDYYIGDLTCLPLGLDLID